MERSVSRERNSSLTSDIGSDRLICNTIWLGRAHLRSSSLMLGISMEYFRSHIDRICLNGLVFVPYLGQSAAKWQAADIVSPGEHVGRITTRLLRGSVGSNPVPNARTAYFPQ